ncbi:MAG TPA: BrnA antitoxin family protein [Terriglobia bacterium]|nr:BrnA antitoxin family protein [Terriglobia bacterium]
MEALARMPDSAIDYSDASAVDRLPSEVHVGRFYRPVKQQISLRVDADVLAWFRSQGGKYQTYINQVLRREMRSHARAR